MSTLDAPATAAPLPPPRLAQFVGPRYWPTWLLLAWLRLMAALPWRVAVEVSRWVGRALWYLVPGRRHVVVRNLEICFPELDSRARLTLARRSFENVAISIAEIAIAWFGRSLPPVRIEGREHLEAALANGNGVILYSGHFATLELTGQFVKPLTPRFAFMFRSRRNRLLDALQAHGRQRTAHLSFDNSDSRAMLRALRDNSVVWYAPDQAYSGSGAELLPFFGEPAMTNVATARLARLSGAVVLPFNSAGSTTARATAFASNLRSPACQATTPSPIPGVSRASSNASSARAPSSICGRIGGLEAAQTYLTSMRVEPRPMAKPALVGAPRWPLRC